MIKLRFLLVSFLLLSLVLIWDSSALAQVVWSLPYTLKKNHTIYLYALQEYGGCGHFYTTTDGGQSVLEDQSASSNFQNSLNDSSFDSFFWYTNVGTTDQYYNPNLTSSSAPSPYYYTSTDNNTTVQFGIDGDCGVIDNTDDNIYWDSSAVSLSQGIVDGVSTDTYVDFDTPIYCQSCGDDGYGYIQDFNTNEYFTDVQKPQTLVVYVAGAGSDPSNANELLNTLQNDLNSGSNDGQFDLEVFPQYSGTFGNHQVIVQNLINFLINLDPSAYSNVFIITHSAGYFMTKLAVMATIGVTYSNDSYTFIDSNNNNQQSALQALFKKAQIISLSPPLGGASEAKAMPPIIFTQDMNPASSIQAWMAPFDNVFKANIGGFQSYEIIGDSMYHGVWSTRGDGGFSPSVWRTLGSVSEIAGAGMWFRFTSDTTETKNYMIEASSPFLNFNAWPPAVGNGSPSSFHVEFPFSIVQPGYNPHHFLCNYGPMESYIENLILAAQNNSVTSSQANAAAFNAKGIISVPKMSVNSQKLDLNAVLGKLGKKDLTLKKRSVFKPLVLPKSSKLKPTLKAPSVKAAISPVLNINSSAVMSQPSIQSNDVTASDICSDYQDLLTYVYNTTDGCYTQFINSVSDIPCGTDINDACATGSYPDNYDGYNTSGDCVNYLSAVSLLSQYDSLADYYDCEFSSQSCVPGSTTVVGNQPYYCGAGGNWIPGEFQGQSCSSNLQCASNQCSTTCQGADPYSNAPVFQTVGSNNVTNGVIPRYSVAIGSNLSFAVTASSPVLATINYTASNLPSGASFSSGNFSWTPQAGQDGTFTALLTASTSSSPVLSTTIPVIISSGSGVNSTNVSWSGSVSLPSNLPTVTLVNGTTYSVTNSAGINLSITGSEKVGLGASFMQFSTDNINWGALQLFSASQYYTISTGNGVNTIYVRFKDVVGNISPVYSSTPFILDTTPPTGSIQINGGAAYTISSSLNLTLSASDNLTGVVWMALSNDDQNWTTVLYNTSYPWNLPSTLASGSSQNVYVKYEDGAGNWSKAYSASVILDTTTPTGSIQINAGAAYTNSTSVALSLTASDSASGVSNMAISNDNTNWTTKPYATSYSWSLPSTLANGSAQTVYVKFQNGAGVWSTVYSASITLDQLTGLISINNGATVTNSLTVTLNLSASAASAITSMRIANTQSAISSASAQTYATTTTWTLASGNGSKTVFVQFEDTLGNWSAVYSAPITLNVVGSVAINGGAPYTNSTAVTLTLVPPSMVAAVQSMIIANTQAGLSTIAPVIYAATKSYTLPAGNGSKAIFVEYRDASGNVSPVYSASITLDTTTPTGSIKINGGATYTNFDAVTLTLAATDSASGINNMAISNDNSNWTTVAYSTSYAWNLPVSLANGASQKVYVKYQSGAGNWSSVYSASIILETAAFNITVSAGANGSISPSGTVSLYYAASQTFTITPNAGYILNQLLVDGSAVTVVTSNNISTYTLSNVTKAHTVSVSFKPVITASAGTGGSISPSGNVNFTNGGNQTFTITASTGYTINQVLVDGAPVTLATGNKYTFSNLTAPHTIAASFTINTFALTVSIGANGNISPSGSVSVNYGSSQVFTVTPNTGYVINQLLVDSSAVTVTTSNNISTYTLSNVTKAHTVTASFKPVIIATAGSGGTISPAGTVIFTSGGSETFTITPSTGYNISQVLVDGVPATLTTGNKYTFSGLTAPHTIAASFAINTFTVTASADTNGSITPAGNVSVNYGSNQMFTVTPHTGCVINQIIVDGKVAPLTASNTYTFSNVTASHTLSASFKPTITASAGTGGSISPTGTVTFADGANQTYTITTNTGYTLNQVLVDGQTVTLASGGTYAFTNITAPHTISASFSINTFPLTVSVGSNGTMTPSGDISVNYGASQVFTITPNAGCTAQLTVDGAVVALSSNTYTISNITAAHTVAVSFMPMITASAGIGGNISPTGSATFADGSNQTYTITPSAGYKLNQVLVDGSAVTLTPSSTYIFNNITAPHTISASFTIISSGPSCSASSDSSNNVSSIPAVASGSYVTGTCASGYIGGVTYSCSAGNLYYLSGSCNPNTWDELYLQTPLPNTVISGSSFAFTILYTHPGAYGMNYTVSVGKSPGSAEYSSQTGYTNDSVGFGITGMPMDGSKIYVTLSSWSSGGPTYVYTYVFISN